MLAVYHADVERLIAAAASSPLPTPRAKRCVVGSLSWPPTVGSSAASRGRAGRHPPGDQRAMAAPGARRRAVIARRRSTRWRATRRSRCRRLLAIAWLSLARATAPKNAPSDSSRSCSTASRPRLDDSGWQPGARDQKTPGPVRAQCGPGVSRMTCDITRWSSWGITPGRQIGQIRSNGHTPANRE